MRKFHDVFDHLFIISMRTESRWSSISLQIEKMKVAFYTVISINGSLIANTPKVDEL